MPTFSCEPGQLGQNPKDLRIENTTVGGEIVKYTISTPKPPNEYENCTIYSTGQTFIGIPNAHGYSLKFDNRTSSQFEHDYLIVYEENRDGPVLFYHSGKQEEEVCIKETLTLCNSVYPWSFTKIASSKGLYLEFSTDSTISDWGIFVTINESSIEVIPIDEDMAAGSAVWREVSTTVC